jgi:type IV pilus assembly protein PilM
MNVTILRNDQPVYAREQAFGGSQLTQDIMRQYGMSQEEAETAKRTATCPRTSNRTCCGRSWTTWRWKSRGPCNSSLPRPSTTRLTTSSWPVVAPSSRVDEAVSGRTQISTVVANPFANMALSQRIRPKNLATDAPSLLVACGLAMRRFDQ